MAFWWPLLVIAFAFAICKLLLLLIPPNVPSIDVDASDGKRLCSSSYLSFLLFNAVNVIRFLKLQSMCLCTDSVLLYWSSF